MTQEFFFTLVCIWILFRLFRGFSSSGNANSSRTYQQTYNFYSNQQQQQRRAEGDVVIEKKSSPESKIPPTEGEYVDYEEVK